MGSRTSECGSFAFESKIDLNHHLQFRYITTLPPNLTIHHPLLPHRATALRMDFRGPPKHSSWRFTSATWASEPPTRSTPGRMVPMGDGMWKFQKVGGFCFLFGGLIFYIRTADSFCWVYILFKSCCWGVGFAKMCSQWMMSCVPDMSGIGSTWSWRIKVKRLNVRTAQEKKKKQFRVLWEKMALKWPGTIKEKNLAKKKMCAAKKKRPYFPWCTGRFFQDP